MKRKSISGFVLGLLSGLFSVGLGYFTFAPLILVLALSVGNFWANAIIFSAILYSMCGISSIIGACLCFRHARAGGIVLLVSALISLIFPILFTYVCIQNLNIFIIALICIPSILSLIGGIVGIIAKPIENKTINSVKEINE